MKKEEYDHIQERIMEDFAAYYDANKKELNEVNPKDECLLCFLSGAEAVISYMRKIQDKKSINELQ